MLPCWTFSGTQLRAFTTSTLMTEPSPCPTIWSLRHMASIAFLYSIHPVSHVSLKEIIQWACSSVSVPSQFWTAASALVKVNLKPWRLTSTVLHYTHNRMSLALQATVALSWPCNQITKSYLLIPERSCESNKVEFLVFLLSQPPE